MAGLLLTISANLLLARATLGLGPSFAGESFLKLKEVPPAEVVARASGGLTLSCSVAGSPTPIVAWFKDGYRLAGTQRSPGGLGETNALLNLGCVTPDDEGVYECRGEVGSKHVSAITKVQVIGFPHSGCMPRGKFGTVPTITGWHSSVMIQSGESTRLSCNINEDAGKVSVVWRDPMGKEVDLGKNHQLMDNDLVINSVDWSHMGRFTCTVQNGYGLDMASTFLYPLAPPPPMQEFGDHA